MIAWGGLYICVKRLEKKIGDKRILALKNGVEQKWEIIFIVVVNILINIYL